MCVYLCVSVSLSCILLSSVQPQSLSPSSSLFLSAEFDVLVLLFRIALLSWPFRFVFARSIYHWNFFKGVSLVIFALMIVLVRFILRIIHTRSESNFSSQRIEQAALYLSIRCMWFVFVFECMQWSHVNRNRSAASAFCVNMPKFHQFHHYIWLTWYRNFLVVALPVKPFHHTIAACLIVSVFFSLFCFSFSSHLRPIIDYIWFSFLFLLTFWYCKSFWLRLQLFLLFIRTLFHPIYNTFKLDVIGFNDNNIAIATPHKSVRCMYCSVHLVLHWTHTSTHCTHANGQIRNLHRFFFIFSI